MSHGKDFTLFTTVVGPNGWKVAMILSELNLSYEEIFLDVFKGENKKPEHTKYNPNGRVPTLVDHRNNDFVIWESCAIIYYLAEKYDTERKISVEAFEDKMIEQQWLFFQGSGQGPYFGQAGYFTIVNPSPHLPEVIERYQKEILRVLGVLEEVLSKQEWLVGEKCTIADISFVPWNYMAENALVRDYKGFNLDKDFPSVAKWHRKLLARPPVADAFARRTKMLGK
ncbi:glutathione transferase Ure2p5 [Irpex rosettiformis]|uniref:Glutathione transferase Ure2p5 n=1 Tax=Irpex rosettiformis TaxID=378272 RepID=A0ACB8TYD5_9APHY|nr:glutathione transferase Ure2p5 [Irpex rosettiformis]